MTKFEAQLGQETTPDFSQSFVLDNCKVVLKGGEMTIFAKDITLLNGSTLEVIENATVKIVTPGVETTQ